MKTSLVISIIALVISLASAALITKVELMMAFHSRLVGVEHTQKEIVDFLTNKTNQKQDKK